MKNLNSKKNTNKPEIPGKVKKGYRIYAMSVLALTLTMSMGVTAFAAGDPIQVVVRSKQLAPPQGKANKG